MLTLISGAVAGVAHVLSGPDHLTAVAPLAIADRRRGWYAGLTWGVGHTSGVVTIATLAVLLRETLPPVELISAWSERLVGAGLIAVGLWALRCGLRISSAPHAHGGSRHAHLHVETTSRTGHAHASFLLGVLHGLAGSSHFLGVLPALAHPSPASAFTYIAAFGAASIVSMAAFAALLSAASAPRIRRTLMLASAGLAFVVGGAWLAP